LSRSSRPRAVAVSRGLPPARVALALGDAADEGRAVRDRRLRSPRVGSRAGVRLGEENERVESSGARRNPRSTPIRRGLRGRRLDGRAPDAEKVVRARNPSTKPRTALHGVARRVVPRRRRVLGVLASGTNYLLKTYAYNEQGTAKEPAFDATSLISISRRCLVFLGRSTLWFDVHGRVAWLI